MPADIDAGIADAVANLNATLQEQDRDVYISAHRIRHGGRSTARHVTPGAVDDTAQELIDQSDHAPQKCRHVARIFDFVRSDIDYEHTGGGLTYPLADLLAHRQGNCVDQSVLLCSLLESQGFTTRVYSVRNGDSGHVLAGVAFNATDHHRIWNDLTDYYTAGVGGMRFDFATQIPVSENARYAIVDPEYSEYPGDLSDLADDGFVTEQSSGWEFTNLTRTVKPADVASSISSPTPE